jgi:hypothetical protein
MFAVYNIITRCSLVHRANGTQLDGASHPSRRGSKGYALEFHDWVICMWMNGRDLKAAWIELMWHQKKIPCM